MNVSSLMNEETGACDVEEGVSTSSGTGALSSSDSSFGSGNEDEDSADARMGVMVAALSLDEKQYGNAPVVPTTGDSLAMFVASQSRAGTRNSSTFRIPRVSSVPSGLSSFMWCCVLVLISCIDFIGLLTAIANAGDGNPVCNDRRNRRQSKAWNSGGDDDFEPVTYLMQPWLFLLVGSLVGPLSGPLLLFCHYYASKSKAVSDEIQRMYPNRSTTGSSSLSVARRVSDLRRSAASVAVVGAVSVVEAVDSDTDTDYGSRSLGYCETEDETHVFEPSKPCGNGMDDEFMDASETCDDLVLSESEKMCETSVAAKQRIARIEDAKTKKLRKARAKKLKRTFMHRIFFYYCNYAVLTSMFSAFDLIFATFGFIIAKQLTHNRCGSKAITGVIFTWALLKSMCAIVVIGVALMTFFCNCDRSRKRPSE